jgi:hypothetical protein
MLRRYARIVDRSAAGAAPGLAAGEAGSLSAQVCQVEMVVADEPCPIQPEAPIARRRLHHASRRVPVDGHDAFALAPLDQHLIAVHRGEEDQPLHPSTVTRSA